MSRKKKSVLSLLLIVLIAMTGCLIVPRILHRAEIARSAKLYADEIIRIPDKERPNTGFTCTGLFWDEKEGNFLLGNAGRYEHEDKTPFQAGVEIVDFRFSRIKNSIPCYQTFPGMRDIQGVCKIADGSIWVCSYGENKVRHMSPDGRDIGSFDLKEANGIAADARTNQLWVLTRDHLYRCDYSGKIDKSFKVKIRGQDQLYLDEKEDLMYLTAGADYQGDSYVYTVDLKTGQVKVKYVLKDSFAVEGMSIVNGIMYVLNDGHYHGAKDAKNQVNCYDLKNIGTEK